MKTYIVSTLTLSDRINKSIHIAKAETPKQAAESALASYEYSIPLALTTPPEEPETFIAFDPEDWSEADVLEGYRTTFDCIEATCLYVKEIESLIGKTIVAGSLTYLPKKATQKR